jgi:hypothetical protein
MAAALACPSKPARAEPLALRLPLARLALQIGEGRAMLEISDLRTAPHTAKNPPGEPLREDVSKVSFEPGTQGL